MARTLSNPAAAAAGEPRPAATGPASEAFRATPRRTRRACPRPSTGVPPRRVTRTRTRRTRTPVVWCSCASRASALGERTRRGRTSEASSEPPANVHVLRPRRLIRSSRATRRSRRRSRRRGWVPAAGHVPTRRVPTTRAREPSRGRQSQKRTERCLRDLTFSPERRSRRGAIRRLGVNVPPRV